MNLRVVCRSAEVAESGCVEHTAGFSLVFPPFSNRGVVR